VKPVELVVQVRCLHCEHKGVLDDQTLDSFGIKPNAPIASFVKRLRCSDCGSGNLIANRITRGEYEARSQLRAKMTGRRFARPSSTKPREDFHSSVPPAD
jgi:uncharacterized protein YlaI